ncbi:hypothetical protein FRC07_000766 [Ceratobasidium sp. 392]|nr:hypothetical protein FRC07_000766 [Ceratobasidium sp. 392]
MPDHHSGIPELLNCLGTTAFYESHWARDPNCLDLAITYFAQSICLCTDVDEQKLMGLKRLGLIYAYRFDTSGNISDIDHAIEFNERALILAPNQSKLSVNLSSNLAEAYINRYKKLRDLLDLNRAASYLKQAVDWASNIEFQEPSLYFKLGSLYRFRYESTRLLQDFQSAVDAYKKAASMSEGNLRVRFQSASIWAAMSTQLAVDAPLEPYQLVMDLAFQMVQVGCTNNERFHQLILVNNIPYYGVQAAIRNREYDLALEWFESCRSTVWKRTLGFHSPTERLQEVNPELASRFKLVSSKFSEVAAFQPAFEDVFGQMVSLGRVEPTHRQLAEDWDNLIAEIRNIEGFEGFLKPYTVAELKRSAQSGPVVLLNTLVSGCDALILRVGLEEIGHVPLPLFSVREAAQLLKSPGPLLGKFRTDGCTKERRPVFESTGITNPLATLLCLLWTSVVKPIIGYLDYQPGTETEELPHITWCISGSIGLLPLHAAGIYDGSEPKSKAFNYMVSSYTPDLSTLLRERSTGSFQGVLMVGQTATRGQARLPGTVDELANIEKHVSGSLLTRLEGKDATPDAVLAAMRKHSWVHLACHASQKHHDFGASSFYLHNGDILDLSTIAREPPRHAEFAFLSACQTAQGDEAVTNEGIHLAGGMLIAGYSSVIASLWPINDKDAPLVADKVYERLFRSEVPDSKQAARALHYAVKCLREKIGEEKLDSWVPYIHMGPQ